MTAISQVVFLQILCKECRALFWMCRSCYRGHCYCSDACRGKARRRQMREANRRHQQSDEGRLDHLDRQRALRARQAQARVTYQSSPALSLSGSLVQVESEPPLVTQQVAVQSLEKCGEAQKLSRTLENASSDLVVCIVCGQSGRFINPFRTG